MWHYLDRDHPWRSSDTASDKSEFVWRYFQRLDESIGQLIRQAGDDTLVIIMSDHGMGPAHNMIVLNNWLLDIGLLQLESNPLTRLKYCSFKHGFTLRNVHKMADRLGLAKHAEYKTLYSVDAILKMIFLSFHDVDWSRSRAYSFGRSVGPIYVNVKGREPQGIVNPGREYEEVREEIAALAEEFTDPRTGRKLVGCVLRREDIYSGPYVDQAPDLILLPAAEKDKFFGLADFGSNQMVQTIYRYSGMHLDNGLLIMMGPQIERQAKLDNASIVDLAPTILYAMGVPIPQDMDGRPLVEVFTGDDAQDIPLLSTVPTLSSRRSEEASYTTEESREIEGRLRQMGYLG